MSDAQIRPTEDVWPRLRAELAPAYDELRRLVGSPDIRTAAFVEMLEARYRNGERLYRREWLDWVDPSRFDHEVVQEVGDGILYIAMRRVRHPDATGLA